VLSLGDEERQRLAGLPYGRAPAENGGGEVSGSSAAPRPGSPKTVTRGERRHVVHRGVTVIVNVCAADVSVAPPPFVLRDDAERGPLPLAFPVGVKRQLPASRRWPGAAEKRQPAGRTGRASG